MTVRYVSVEDAIERDGLRMVVVGGVPSPWGEAAKGILHIKRIEWVAVRLVYDDERLKQWAGQRSGPVAVYGDERLAPAGRTSSCSRNVSRRLRRCCPRTRLRALWSSASPTRSAAKAGSVGRVACN